MGKCIKCGFETQNEYEYYSANKRNGFGRIEYTNFEKQHDFLCPRHTLYDYKMAVDNGSNFYPQYGVNDIDDFSSLVFSIKFSIITSIIIIVIFLFSGFSTFSIIAGIAFVLSNILFWLQTISIIMKCKNDSPSAKGSDIIAAFLNNEVHRGRRKEEKEYFTAEQLLELKIKANFPFLNNIIK